MADQRGRGRGRGAGDRGRGGDRGGGGGGRGRGGFDGSSDRGGGGRGGARGGRGGFEPPRVFGNGSFPQPNAEVSKAEDAVVKDLSAALAQTSLEDRFPQRPGYGTKGTPIILWTNYLQLDAIQADTILYRYSISFQGREDPPKPKKKRLIQLLLKQAPFSEVTAASDWAQVIVATKKVKLDAKRAKYDVEWFPADGEPLPKAEAGESAQQTSARTRNTFALLVEEIGTVSVKELMKDLDRSTTTYPLKLETIQALNIIMAQGPGTDDQITVAGQNRFYPFGKHPQVQYTDLGFGLQALRGYFSSVRTSVNRILVNVNVATGAFYKSGPLLDLLREFGGNPRTPKEHQKMASFVRKLRIETNYLPDRSKKGKSTQGQTKRKVHVIFDLSPFGKNALNTTFQKSNPDGGTTKVSVADYFHSEYAKYGLKLQFPQAPLVNYGARDKPKWIPGELCSVLPGQLARRLLLGEQTREMIKFAARRPAANADSIVGDGLQVTKILPVSQGVNTNLKPFGIKVSTTLLTVHGRVLQAPALQYRAKTCTPRNGAWNLDVRELGQKPFKMSKPLPSWGCLVIQSGRFDTIEGGPEMAKEHLDNFRKTLDIYGMNPGPYQGPGLLRVDFNDLQNKEVDKIKGQVTQAIQNFKSLKFLFIILANDNAVMYDCIKYVCDIKLGIPTVCSIGKKFSKTQGQLQYFANVAMKFNQKLGGINHSISPDMLKPLDAQTIVFGIDVTHPSPGSSDSSPSIAGIVASVDGNFAQYPASIRTQEGRKEMVSELEQMVLERFRLWQKRNGRLPTKVIVYRDGVSEGQYRIVLEEEYPSFVKAFNQLYGAESKHPKISVIVVGKRHHTRFYPTKLDDNNADVKTGNPKPGTVVDRGVTGEKLFDFFLLAHQGLQGTSKPAHYVVIKDENKLGADQLQTLTHNLCYTFARATRAVSVCPPAYYADLLCERGRSYLHSVLKGEGSAFTANDWHGGVHNNLAESMFYL